jgi:hypothetical protein
MQRRAREYLCAALCSRQVVAPALPDAVRSIFMPMRCGRGRAPPRMEQSFHPPQGGSRACRTPECAKLCSRPVAAPALPDGGRSVFMRLRRQRRRAPHRMEQSSIPARRQQSVPHSECATICSRPDAARRVFMRLHPTPVLPAEAQLLKCAKPFSKPVDPRGVVAEDGLGFGVGKF